MIEVPLDKVAERRRLWAMGAHLCGLVAPFGSIASLIGTVVVFNLRRADVPFVRENARHALNAQITLSLGIVLLAIPFFASIAVLAANRSASASAQLFSHVLPVQIALWVAGEAMLVTAAVWNAFGARAAYLGRVYRYPFAIPFVPA